MNGLGGDFRLLGRLLDVASLRQRVIAANLANANTPGFKRLEVSFEEQLRAALTAGAEAVEALRPQVRVDESGPTRFDGNNVETERELVDLNKNTLLYQTLAQVAVGKASMLRAAIAGRGF